MIAQLGAMLAGLVQLILAGFVWATSSIVGEAEVLKIFLITFVVGLICLAVFRRILEHEEEKKSKKQANLPFSHNRILFLLLSLGGIGIINSFLYSYVIAINDSKPVDPSDYVSGAFFVLAPFITVLWSTYLSKHFLKMQTNQSLILGLTVAVFTSPFYIIIIRDYLNLVFSKF